MDNISYGIVQGYDARLNTVDIKLDGDDDDSFLLQVPVSSLSSDITCVPEPGARCVVAHARSGGAAVCLGFAGTTGEASDAEREAQGAVEGDLRFGREDSNMLTMQRGGFTLLQASPGTGIMMHGDEQVINLIGSQLFISTPSLNGGVEQDATGQPKIALFLYNALGKIFELLMDATRVLLFNAPNLFGCSITLGGDPSNPTPFYNINIVSPQGVTSVHIGTDAVAIAAVVPVAIASSQSVSVNAPNVSVSGMVTVNGMLNVNGVLSVNNQPLTVP